MICSTSINPYAQRKYEPLSLSLPTISWRATKRSSVALALCCFLIVSINDVSEAFTLDVSRSRSRRVWRSSISSLRAIYPGYDDDGSNYKRSIFAPPDTIKGLEIEHSQSQLQRKELQRLSTQNSNYGPPLFYHGFHHDAATQSYQLDFLRVDTYNNHVPISVRRVSHTPHIFHIKNFVSAIERQTLLWAVINQSSLSKKNGLMPDMARTISSTDDTPIADPARPNSKVIWVSPSTVSQTSRITDSLMRSCAALLIAPPLLAESNHHWDRNRILGAGQPTNEHFEFVGCEDMQMVHYTKKGGFLMHHDSVPRILTVIFYLNGVAGTWFPLAEIDNYNNNNINGPLPENVDKIPLNKPQAEEMMRGFIPGKDGVLISSTAESAKYGGGFVEKVQNAAPASTETTTAIPEWNWKNVQPTSQLQQQSSMPSNGVNPATTISVEAGDAVAFYNYMDVETLKNNPNMAMYQDWINDMHGRIEWKAIHQGLPTDANEKWIATLWFLVDDNYNVG